MIRNNAITASRQSCALRCMRQHYWQCEVGLRLDKTSVALTFGTAWHTAMEARAKGYTFEESLAFALPEGVQLDGYMCQTLAALLLGYWRHYGQEAEVIRSIRPEQKFKFPMPGSPFFTLEGKIDGLAELHDDRLAFVEHKTTSSAVDATSEYWERLRFNIQILQYALACRAFGWNFEVIIYDVVRKPKLKPKAISNLDKDGLKIVVDSLGQRVFLKSGKPRLTGSTERGYELSTHVETPEEYGKRLEADIQARPEFYFARREVPVLESDIKEFVVQRQMFARTLIFSRQMEKSLERPELAWPRNVGYACKYCSYRSFCLQNDTLNLEQLPKGFTIQGFNPELADDSNNEEENGGGLTETSVE